MKNQLVDDAEWHAKPALLFSQGTILLQVMNHEDQCHRFFRQRSIPIPKYSVQPVVRRLGKLARNAMGLSVNT